MVKKYQQLLKSPSKGRTKGQSSYKESPASTPKSKTTNNSTVKKGKISKAKSSQPKTNKSNQAVDLNATHTKRSHKHKYLVLGPKVFKVSMKILREIRNCQRSSANLIPKLPFSRVVQELIMEYLPSGRIQKIALEAIQEATEAYVVQFLEDSNACALHARRNTLTVRDLAIVKHLRREYL